MGGGGVWVKIKSYGERVWEKIRGGGKHPDRK